jgi:hypothetical protein
MATPPMRRHQPSQTVSLALDHSGNRSNNWKGEISVWHVEDDDVNQTNHRVVQAQAAFRFHYERAQEAIRSRNRFNYNFQKRHLEQLEAPSPWLQSAWQTLQREEQSLKLSPVLVGGIGAVDW